MAFLRTPCWYLLYFSHTSYVGKHRVTDVTVSGDVIDIGVILKV